jgi:serine protease
MTRRRLVLTVAVVVALVAGSAAVALALLGRPAGPKPAPLIFIVDPTVGPSVESVEPIEGRSEQRKVGALTNPDGGRAELVLDEVIVHVRNAAELTAFLGRWGGQVLDSFPADAEGQDHLVRVDLSRADPAALPADLLATEPHQSGTHRVSDERVLRLLALAAAEWRAGTELVVDWLTEPTGIADGQVYESEDITTDVDGNEIPKNVFDWSYMRTGGNMDIGVAAAWQLLQAHGKLTPQVRYMVMDGGFNQNFDFPKNAKIRKGEWGKKNPHHCTNDSSCPWHGTDVVLAAMATVDNKYGTAGPAGPVVSQLIAVGNDLDYWSRMRRLDDVAREEHPDVVNLSFTNHVDAGGAHAQKWTDRRMRHVQDTGALIVAAAGNDKTTVDSDTLFVPCESIHVMCVGGLANNSATVASGSNFGQGDSRRSVEIYGPMCVRTIHDPNRSALDFTTMNTCGTSVASPFVGGIAALVMAADPTLSPEEVRNILNLTANVGGLGAKVTGSQRRVNALQAVARALAVDVVPPTMKIEAPKDGRELGMEDWVDLRGTATDFMGRPVKLHWESDKDGVLADGSKTTVKPLSLGKHTITASATDSTGRMSSAKVTVTVVDTPPKVKLVSPSGEEFMEGDAVDLVGDSVDPDNWQPMPADSGEWEVRRGTTVVHTATGHSATMPGAKVTPGSYTVRFTVAGVRAESTFTVKAVPPGQTKPTAVVTVPTRKRTIGYGQTVTFAGHGTDAEDGALDGTHYRWVASSGGTVKVLCEGSAVPRVGPPGGGFIAKKSCGTFSKTGADLGLAKGDVGYTTWTVKLVVFDSTGNYAKDSVEVAVYFNPP